MATEVAIFSVLLPLPVGEGRGEGINLHGLN